MRRPIALIADGRASPPGTLRASLLRIGCEVIEGYDKDEALRLSGRGTPDLIVICASASAPWGGIELARSIRGGASRTPLILITANSSEELAIAALKAGINDYFRQPVSLEELAASVNRLLWDAVPVTDPSKHSEVVPRLIGGDRMIAESRIMRDIKSYIGRVASTDSTVLVTGETGTGKELAAELIHLNSPRHRNPLACINCAAIPDTLFESEMFGHERGSFTGAYSQKEGTLKSADGGTAFFDEIGDMSTYAQSKVLRVLETRELHRLGGNRTVSVNVRVIAATNQNLEQLVEEGKFRKDLYFRLNVARIHLPPLRERKEDIVFLLDHYLVELNRQFGLGVEGFTEDVSSDLLGYGWPGNVRELRNLLESIFVNLPPRRISFTDLPELFRRRLGRGQNSPPDERERVLSALWSTRWNKTKAAEKLHWSRMTLYRKMEKYQITEIASASS